MQISRPVFKNVAIVETSPKRQESKGLSLKLIPKMETAVFPSTEPTLGDIENASTFASNSKMTPLPE
jgi:hypothetical protein